MKGETTFSAALKLCGLSRSEGAHYLGIAEGTLQKWCSVKTSCKHNLLPPQGVWEELAMLYQRITDTSDGCIPSLFDQQGDLAVSDVMLLHIEADDPEDPLPTSCKAQAGAMALMGAILKDLDECAQFEDDE